MALIWLMASATQETNGKNAFTQAQITKRKATKKTLCLNYFCCNLNFFSRFLSNFLVFQQWDSVLLESLYHSLDRSAVNICTGHLPYQRGRRWSKTSSRGKGPNVPYSRAVSYGVGNRGLGVWRVGVGEAKRPQEGRVQTFRIHELSHRNLWFSTVLK